MGRRKKENPGKLPMGSLVLRHGVYSVRWHFEGRQFQKSTGKKVKEEAVAVAMDILSPFLARRREDVAAALAGRVERASRAAAEVAPALHVVDLWDAYLRAPERPPDTSPETMRMYFFQVDRFLRWIGLAAPTVREVRDVSATMAARFLADLDAGGATAGTVNKYRTLLRRIWKCVKPEARWTENPWEETRPRAETPVRRRALSQEEVERLIAAAAGEWRTLFLVGAYSGLRLRDAVRLRVEDIHDGRIQLAPLKTRRHGTEVRVPLHPVLADALKATGVKSGPYMPGIARRYAKSPSDVSHRVQEIFARAGIETTVSRGEGRRPTVVAGFHSLRHTFVSRLADAGASLLLVQSLVGHTTPTMTAHYYHADDEKAAAAIAAMEGPGTTRVAPVQDTAARIAELEAELARLKAGSGTAPAPAGHARWFRVGGGRTRWPRGRRRPR